MKKYMILAVATLFSVAASAQKFTASNIDNAKAGETAELVINMVDGENIYGTQMTVILPEGMKIAKKSHVSLNEDQDPDELFTLTYMDNKTLGGKLISYAGSTTDPFAIANGEFVTITITIDAAVKDGVYDIKIAGIGFADKAGNFTPTDDVTVKIGVNCATGINAVSAAKANGAIYNLAGQRVNKAQKGIFIQNGVKILK